MTTLAEFMIIAGADNRPPMLEKSLYDSWKSRMEFYMENRENGIMILDSVQNGLLVYPTITKDDGTTRQKTYAELSASEKLQADCDCKATNIVLQGLPPDVYAIVSHHKVAKEIWDKVKLLMQGTKLSLQEKECKLYDEFNMLTFVKGETLYQYYWRFAQFNNNIHSSITPSQEYKSHQTSSVPQTAYTSPQPLTKPLTEFPQVDSGLAVHVFNQGADLISCLNKAMAFLTAVASLRLRILTHMILRIVSNTKTVLMANLSNYGSDVILETVVQDTNMYAQQDQMILSVIEQMSEQMINHVNNWEKANQEKNNESLTADLERYKKRVKTFKQHLNIDLSTHEKMIDSQMDDMIKENLALKQQFDSLEQIF
nr:hypothetical protein [Tanacetum cinerariifolium]